MDRQFGLESEARLEKYFLDNYGVKRTLDRYNAFDFESDKILIELKTRRAYHNTYFDTMISASKVDKGTIELRNGRKERVLFFFQFTDGLYYYEHKEDIIMRKDYFKGVLYYFIQVEMLKETENCRPCPVSYLRGI